MATISELVEKEWNSVLEGFEFDDKLNQEQVLGTVTNFSEETWDYIRWLVRVSEGNETEQDKALHRQAWVTKDTASMMIKTMQFMEARDGVYTPHTFVKKIVQLAREFVSSSPDSKYLRERFGVIGKEGTKAQKYISYFLADIVTEPMFEMTAVPAENGFFDHLDELLWLETVHPYYLSDWITKCRGRDGIDVKKAVKDIETGNKNRAMNLEEAVSAGVCKMDKEGFTPKKLVRVIPYLRSEGVFVDTLSLICDLLNRNEKGKNRYECSLPMYIPEGENQEPQSFKFSSRTIAGTTYQASFSTSIWKNMYHDIKTCKFNGELEMIASMLDCADSHIHYLLVTPTLKNKKRGEHGEFAASMLIILVDGIIEKGGKRSECLIVEGVYGTPWQPECIVTRGKDDEGKYDTPWKKKEEDKITPLQLELYKYVDLCIVEIAHHTKRSIVFNYCFAGGHYPSQGTPDYVNYRIGYKTGDPEKKYYSLRVHPKSGANSFDHIREKNTSHFDANGIRKAEDTAPDRFCSARGLRRFNSFYEWNELHQLKEEAFRK